ncbi:hypothetical protein [Streptomyces sp. NPDC005799]|uniref:hypothetical protein n=1 Tax=Streptomyces sp. NPDC005799 TaxID=3154678 RepID=UPI0033E8A8A3
MGQVDVRGRQSGETAVDVVEVEGDKVGTEELGEVLCRARLSVACARRGADEFTGDR